MPSIRKVAEGSRQRVFQLAELAQQAVEGASRPWSEWAAAAGVILGVLNSIMRLVDRQGWLRANTPRLRLLYFGREIDGSAWCIDIENHGPGSVEQVKVYIHAKERDDAAFDWKPATPKGHLNADAEVILREGDKQRFLLKGDHIVKEAPAKTIRVQARTLSGLKVQRCWSPNEATGPSLGLKQLRRPGESE